MTTSGASTASALLGASNVDTSSGCGPAGGLACGDDAADAGSTDTREEDDDPGGYARLFC